MGLKMTEKKIEALIDKSVRKSVCSKLLLDGLKQKISDLNNMGISFEKIACDCVSDEGLILAKRFKLTKVENAFDKEIYEGELKFK